VSNGANKSLSFPTDARGYYVVAREATKWRTGRERDG